MGPSIAGLLIQLVTAPFAIVLDALSFLGSAAFLWRIQTPEPAARDGKRRSSFSPGPRLLAGMRTLLRHPILRSFIASLAAFNFFSYMLRALYVLYLLSILGIPPAFLG